MYVVNTKKKHKYVFRKYRLTSFTNELQVFLYNLSSVAEALLTMNGIENCY